MSRFKLPLVCAVVLPAQLASISSFAQIEEVVVTARKQSESLQEVPLAITAFSSETMERGDFVNLEDVAGNTVGLNYSGESSSGYQSSPTIRGLRQGFAQDRVQNVAIFLDGVYLSRQSMANMGMVDMERIEVVKGPQNSLYGRNAFAGAINYVTKKPQEEFEAYVSTTQGKDGREDWKVSLNGPLIENVLLARYTIGRSEYDGPFDNTHPLASADPTGFSNGGSDEKVGGWDDETYNLGFTWLASENVTVDTGYFNTSLKKESQGGYIMGGVREVARFQTTPFNDMNFNTVTHLTNVADKAGGSFEGLASTGNTLWKGALPLQPVRVPWSGGLDPVLDANGDIVKDANGQIQYIPGTDNYNWGLGDGVTGPDERRLGTNLDPRGFGFKADTEVMTFSVNWDINDVWSLAYNMGYIDHEGIQVGAASRDPLWGNSLTDNNADSPGRADVEMQSNVSSSRPIIELTTVSHEFRFDWSGSDDYSFSFGGYYSDSEDEQFSQTTYNPICTTADRLYDADQDPERGCYEPFGDNTYSPLYEAEFQGVAIYELFRDSWSGQKADYTIFDEQVYAVFAMFEYNLTPDLSFRVEARYTEEDKEIERLTDNFAIPAGGYYAGSGFGVGETNSYSTICAEGETTIVTDPDAPSSQEGDPCISRTAEDTFHYFTPKYSVDWQINDESMIYAYIANGLKAGGFNNTSDPDQGTYDEEVNWTYEIGSKNVLFEGMMQLNVAAYIVEWEDLVGGVAPTGVSESPNAGSVQANIGDVENYGFEIDGLIFINENFSVDFGAAYTNPRYEDDVKYADAKTAYYYECTPENLLTDTNPDGTPIGGNFDAVIDFDENCGNDDIGGNDLIKVSKEQYTLGFNYSDDFDNGWTMNLRLNGNYQSRQYIDPLNLAFIRSRTLWNMSMNFQGPEHWEFTVWGKNITDKEYVAGSFHIGIFNKHIVSLGAPANYGATLKYNF
ncbi:TonB-dependent receptor [Oceanicoccus sagamiensis]|uniref:TonB-dependent receptor n=1 Tax=Oceanicoccus sagamiensis TaxID=716816 RepID=A0A1X9NG33_9GAMM|nr:TonB-dependent receptor [Oceanicoccus sagamiensis]ARN76131.1 hypothetical protein BST96_19735 [Oceanicoccus sagamiensis]